MKKLYYAAVKFENPEKHEQSFIRLSETPEGIFKGPEVQRGFIGWAMEGNNENSFATLVDDLVFRPINQMMYFAPEHSEVGFFRHAAELVARERAEFIAVLLAAGVDDEKKNKQNFSNHVTSVFESLKNVIAGETIIVNNTAAAAIKKIDAMAQADYEGVFAALDDWAVTAYYPAETRKTFKSLVARSAELLDRITPSEIFMELFKSYSRAAACVATGNYASLTKQQFSPPYAFTPSQRLVEAYTGKVAPLPGMLAMKEVHTVGTESVDLGVREINALLDKHPIIKYETNLGEVRYAIRDPKLIQPLTNERE